MIVRLHMRAADRRPSMGKRASTQTDPEQYQRFLEAAKELGCSENAYRLDEVVRRAAKLSPERRIEPDKPRGNRKTPKE